MFQFLTGGRNAIRFAFSPNVVPRRKKFGIVEPGIRDPWQLGNRVRILDNLFHISNPTILSDLLCENSRNWL